MKTTGQILHETRIAKKLDLEDVSRITRIRPNQLRLIESDDYIHLADATVARGFIRNYAEFLNLNPDHLLAVFRRDFVENEMGQIIPRGMVEPINRPVFWTPRTTIIAAVFALFTAFGGYLGYQYYLLTGPPRLVLLQPADNVSVTEPSVEIFGSTDPEVTLTVNGQAVVLENKGEFYFRYSLNPGLNTITVAAAGKSGKTTTLVRNITLTTGP